MFKTDIGIDLGTATIIVYICGKGPVLKEPSVIAVNKDTDAILAVGDEARSMLGRTPGNIVALQPMREGVISDYHYTEKMLKYFIAKAIGRPLFRKPRIAICVPSNVTEVERRAVEEAARQAGARQVYVIEEPIAAAIGAGIDIAAPRGTMVVDIGGGTTDVAVISLGGTVEKNSIKVAGNHFDEAIIRHMRRRNNLLIGERTAEDMKILIGTAFNRTESVSMDVRGRDLLTGLPKTMEITSEEMHEALYECIMAIVDAVCRVLERTPPELVSDIADYGILMTGGGCLLYGLDKLLAERTGINTYVAEDPVNCVAIGTGRYIEYLSEGKLDVIDPYK